MTDGEIESRITELLSQMTLDEKVGQLCQAGPSMAGGFGISVEEMLNMVLDGRMSREEFHQKLSSGKRDYHEEEIRQGKLGSMTGISDAATTRRLQKIAVEESRLHIPLLFGQDVVHGFRTVTPIPLAESCSFDPDLFERTARMAAEEAAAAGIRLTFAPMVDVAKDARWGRIAESAGEDTLLNSIYGEAKVRGFQTDHTENPTSLAACVKHFAAYGQVEGGRDYNRVEISKERLEEDFLPPFRAAVKAGALAIMPSFNDINGVPSSANRWLLTCVLRKRWGFAGMTDSDSNAIAELVNHGVTKDRREAALAAAKAGLDMDMASGCYGEHLKALVESGEWKEEELDRLVRHVLYVKFRLGLFEHPYTMDEARQKMSWLSRDHLDTAYRAALESMVLLKNDGVLPLSKEPPIAVYGALSADRAEMTGTWALDADTDACISVQDALKKRAVPFRYCKTGEEAAEGDEELVLCCIGEKKAESGEASSRACLDLPEEDLRAIRLMKKAGKKIVAVLFNGRPLAIPELKEMADAILEAWHPGTEAGEAVCDLVYGIHNPEGKLTTTFPNTAGQCPMYYDAVPTGRPAGRSHFTSKYIDVPSEPVFPFGFGLSYTTYEYGKPAASCEEDGVTLSVSIRNTGNRAGTEIAQCYFRDPVALRTRPARRLVGFQRVPLKPGEEKKICFPLPWKAFAYFHPDGSFGTDAGDLILMTGPDSAHTKEVTITAPERVFDPD